MQKNMRAQDWVGRLKVGQRLRVTLSKHIQVTAGDIVVVCPAKHPGRLFVTTPDGKEISLSGSRVTLVSYASNKLLLLC